MKPPAVYLITHQPSEYCLVDSFGVETCTQYPYYSYGAVGAFLLFNAIWTILTLVVLVLVPLRIKVSTVVVTVLDGLAMLLWLAGGIMSGVMVANFLGAITYGMVVLALVIWALFLASFVLNLLSTIRGRGRAMHQPQPAFRNYKEAEDPEVAHI